MYYTVYRNDRNPEASNKNRDGGVMIAVSKKINLTPIYTSDPSVEYLFVKMVLGNAKIIVGAVYMPPLCSKAVFERHLQFIDDIVLRNPSYEIVLLGDYNLSSVLLPVLVELSPNINNVNRHIIKENTRIVCDGLQQYKLLQKHLVLNMES